MDVAFEFLFDDIRLFSLAAMARQSPQQVFDASLVREAKQFAASVPTYRKRGARHTKNMWCKLCIKRCFPRACRLKDHVLKHHTKKKPVPFACRKLQRAAKAVFDNDRLQGKPVSDDYLQRAAKTMKAQIGSALKPSASTHIDDVCSLVLDGDGPRYVPKAELVSSHVRKVGEMYYTKAFALIVPAIMLKLRMPLQQASSTYKQMRIACEQTESVLTHPSLTCAAE